jgi:cytidyltransferase-like protein
MSSRTQIAVSGGFDDIRSRDLRFLEEAAKLGEVTVLLWPDETLQRLTGRAPKFALAERTYLLNAVRYVGNVVVAEATIDPDKLPADWRPDAWVDRKDTANSTRKAYCQRRRISYHVLRPGALRGFPAPPPTLAAAGRKTAVATGCYDWFHSGHVRFFEEVSTFGDLYVVVGHDINIRRLKGMSHPLQLQDERRYVVGSIKYVKQALISSGDGWLDADPEIRRLKPEIYAVNADGDQGGKREYCTRHGIQYLVFDRLPAPGLPARSSTDLRGF